MASVPLGVSDMVYLANKNQMERQMSQGIKINRHIHTTFDGEKRSK
jgi:hypothetical protein